MSVNRRSTGLIYAFRDKIASENNSKLCAKKTGCVTSETPEVPLDLDIENTIDFGDSDCEANK